MSICEALITVAVPLFTYKCLNMKVNIALISFNFVSKQIKFVDALLNVKSQPEAIYYYMMRTCT